MTTNYITVTDAAHVTDEILTLVREICDGWYLDKPIDWEDVWERVEKTPYPTFGSYVDLGPEVNTPAMRAIQRAIRAERRAS